MNVSLSPRIEKFLDKPWGEKRKILSGHVRRAWYRGLSSVPVPIVKRLDPGFLWIAWDDVIREAVLNGSFERAERDFVLKFLQPGMTVLDIGAYHGLYTLISSLRVGTRGRVIAFEPSPWQMKKLQWHVRMNCCGNVRTEKSALSNSEGESEFFQVSGGSEGCSSLRSPDVNAAVRSTRVPVTTLDSYLERNPLPLPIDFMKVDVEGGELDLFKGASRLLRQRMRPVILSELQDIRTRPWGYQANDVAYFLQGFGYRWFKPAGDGNLVRLHEKEHHFDGNYVAVPEERMSQVKEMIENEPHW